MKNYPNIANRAKRLYALGAEGEEKVHKIPADNTVVSIGYIPDNNLYETIKDENVYLIGDAKKPTNVMDAIWAAYKIAMKI